MPRKNKLPTPRRLLIFAGALGVVMFAGFTAFSLLDSAGVFRMENALSAKAEARPVLRRDAPAPEFEFTTLDGAQHRLSEYSGRPVMLWLIATWCPTCISATVAVAQEYERLQGAGLQIIQLKLHENLGYPGPSIEDFATRIVPGHVSRPGWVWGDASKEGSLTYDARGLPDVYFLIDKDGILRDAGVAPNVTMDKILSFAGLDG